MSLIENLMAAAQRLGHVLNLTDCDLRNDKRFAGRGVVVPLEERTHYGVAGEEHEATDIEGHTKRVVYQRLPPHETGDAA